MKEPETINLYMTRDTVDGKRVYESPGSGVTLILHRIQPPEQVSLTIAPLLSKKERKLKVLRRLVAEGTFDGASILQALSALERIDRETP